MLSMAQHSSLLITCTLNLHNYLLVDITRKQSEAKMQLPVIKELAIAVLICHCSSVVLVFMSTKISG